MALLSLAFVQCKKDEPTPAAPITDNFIGSWENYDHFVYNHVLDTAIRDTNAFVMFDMDVPDGANLIRYSHAGGAAVPYPYTRTNQKLVLQTSGSNIEYKIAKLTSDSLILESKVGPQGGIPTPQEDKSIWYFIKK